MVAVAALLQLILNAVTLLVCTIYHVKHENIETLFHPCKCTTCCEFRLVLRLNVRHQAADAAAPKTAEVHILDR